MVPVLLVAAPARSAVGTAYARSVCRATHHVGALTENEPAAPVLVSASGTHVPLLAWCWISILRPAGPDAVPVIGARAPFARCPEGMVAVIVLPAISACAGGASRATSAITMAAAMARWDGRCMGGACSSVRARRGRRGGRSLALSSACQ